ncbi:MAG TPA: glycosyltransferase family 4 protein, partial [Rhizomicrobium sp.]
TCNPNFPQGRLYPGYRNRLRQSEDIEGVRVVRVWSLITPNDRTLTRMLAFFSFMISSFLAAFFEPRPDIVTSTSPQFFCAVGAWAHAMMRRLPYVFELGDLWPASITALGAMAPNLFLRLMEKFELFLYRRADAVIALTADFKRDLISRGIRPDKIVVIRNGVDLTHYAPRPRNEALAAEWGLKEKFIVAYIGTHGLAHALDRVLDAAQRLEKRSPEIAFLFVGDGAKRKELNTRKEKDCLTNVVLTGARPKVEMPDWWSLADLALVSLRNIPLFTGVIPSKIFEAMGMGVPILFFGPVGEASGIVEDAGCGLLVPAEDAQALAEAVLQVAQDPKAMQRLRARCVEAAPSYSRAEQARHTLEVYRGVLEGHYREIKEALA